MYYYKFNIADWHLATSHLSLEEEAVYFKLINFYYDTESPIPEETQMVIRKLRLGSYMDIVGLILNEFFILEDDGWHHKRCDEELEIYKKKAENNKEVGKLGGRPKKIKDLDNNPEITQMVSINNPDITLTKNQEPLTINQEPLTINQDKNIIVNNRVDSPVNCPHDEVISLYHSMLPTLRRVEIWNDTRKGYLKARWREAFATFDLKTKEEGLEYFEEIFGIVKESAFLLGKTNNKDGKTFQADLEWILRPTNFAKIVERKYSK
jgi:uncharacterized protein YdaU (DUF1376 family)